MTPFSKIKHSLSLMYLYANIGNQMLAEGQHKQGFDGVSFVQYHPDFAKVVRKEARQALLLSSAESSRNSFFHNGCTLVVEPVTPASGNSDSGSSITGPSHEEVIYTTSSLLQTASSSQLPVILISRVRLRRNGLGHVVAAEWTKLRPPANLAMPAGATAYQMPVKNGRSSGVLYCAQGNPSPGTSGLFYMPHGKPPVPLITSYYGRDFNSVYDVARHPSDSSLWFTDPCMGFEQDFRKRPQMPCHVYRFHPDTGDLRVVADGLNRPAGICFSADAATAYITDTDSIHNYGVGSSGSGGGSGGVGSIFGGFGASNNQTQDVRRSATIYAYDVLRRGGSDFLTNKRVFAYALRGVPMGLQCDAAGNVYAGCADGVEVWNAGGALLGVIEVPGGVTSFCFSGEGEMFLCSGQQLWWVHVKPEKELSLRAGLSAVDPMMAGSDLDDNFI
ncbi:hypothetical protein SCUCBS95973_001240 [Sporothrix curviconia]|uniref:SMP-30/Gluconolactonase/LRE-like region domain-containing protein n=1 Tax=Sporothrix curviconia TaxID=1260050 RepID=A0ABP0AX47_9PEZI